MLPLPRGWQRGSMYTDDTDQYTYAIFFVELAEKYHMG